MSSPFVGEWIIETWKADESIVAGGIPRDAFQGNSLLTITQPDSGVNSFSLQWFDQSQASVSASDLHSDPSFPSPALVGENVRVSFPTGDVRCDITLQLRDQDQNLDGRISVASSGGNADKEGPETGSGTFTATANGG